LGRAARAITRPWVRRGLNYTFLIPCPLFAPFRRAFSHLSSSLGSLFFSSPSQFPTYVCNRGSVKSSAERGMIHVTALSLLEILDPFNPSKHDEKTMLLLSISPSILRSPLSSPLPSFSLSLYPPFSCCSRLRSSLLGLTTHARVSTGFLPRPQTIIAIPRVDTEEDCHFSAIFLRFSNVDSERRKREREKEKEKDEVQRRLRSFVAYTSSRRDARTSPEEKIVRSSSVQSLLSVHPSSTAWFVVLHDHLAADFTRMATRRAGSRHRQESRDKLISLVDDHVTLRCRVTSKRTSVRAFFRTVVKSSAVVEATRCHTAAHLALSHRYRL